MVREKTSIAEKIKLFPHENIVLNNQIIKNKKNRKRIKRQK